MTAASAPMLTRGYAALLPPLALAAFGLVIGAVVWASGDTFGFDFLAYHQAATRVLSGEPLYDPSVQETGGFGLFYYPPPFVLPLLPLALVPGPVGALVWLGVSAGAFFLAVYLMPVRPAVRWGIVLLAAQMWPVAYSFKLGQVGPLLMLAFVAAWRWLDVPSRLGTAAAIGALIKLQPALLLVWATLTGRWRAVAVGVAVGLVACLVATLIVGFGAWFDYVALLRNVSDPVTTPRNFTPGAVAFQLGATPEVGALVQLTFSVAVVLTVVAAARWLQPDASLLVAVVASQLLSPVLWDHYAMLLLVPVAWLLQRRQWWAVIVPLAVSIPISSAMPPAVYPAMFLAVLAGLLVCGRPVGRDRRAVAAAPTVSPGAARG